MGDDKPQTPVPPPSIPVYATSGSPAPVPAIATAPSMADDTAHASAGRENSAIPPEVKQEAADVDMTDSPIPTSQPPPQLQQQQHSRLTAERSPAPATTATPSAAPRNSTPLRQTNGQDGGSSSRAASQHPESGPSGTGNQHHMPSAPVAHGAPVRQYLNQNVTGVLLAGMKEIAQNQYASFFLPSFLSLHSSLEVD